MSVTAVIRDPRSGLQAEVVDGEEANALVVATRPLKLLENKVFFMANDIYGIDMNKDGRFTGTPIIIHDGLDTTKWTASTISGTWDFNSGTQAHGGSASIDATATVNGDVVQIAKGSSQSLTGYTAITGWIYLDNWIVGTKAIHIYGWDTGTSSMIGSLGHIENYINTATLGVWQQFAIPLGDMGLSGQTIDSVRFQTEAVGVAPDYYIDDIQIEETGGGIVYKLEAEPQSWLHVKTINLIFADAHTGFTDTSDATTRPTMPNLPYDKILSATLIKGFIYERTHGVSVGFITVIQNMTDLMSFPGARVTGYGSDGTNSWVAVSIDLPGKVILKYESNDKLALTIRDDMTSLLLMRVSVGGEGEYRG